MRINQRIRKLRLARGYTLEKLAQLSNLTKGYLSKVERSEEPPPVSTLQTIAVALGVDISEFFEKSSEHHTVSDNLDIVHSTDAIDDFISQAGYTYRPLVKHFRGKYMTPFLMSIEPGETDAFSHDSEEFCYVLEGHVQLCYEDSNQELGPGDAFYFDSRKPHHFVNKSDQTAVVLAVNYNYRRF